MKNLLLTSAFAVGLVALGFGAAEAREGHSRDVGVVHTDIGKVGDSKEKMMGNRPESKPIGDIGGGKSIDYDKDGNPTVRDNDNAYGGCNPISGDC